MKELVDVKTCKHLMDTKDFRPVHCSICDWTVWHNRTDCPNWQRWLAGSSTLEVKEEIPDYQNPDKERDIKEED